MKSEIMHHLSAAKRGCLSKNELAFTYFLANILARTR